MFKNDFRQGILIYRCIHPLLIQLMKGDKMKKHTIKLGQYTTLYGENGKLCANRDS